VKLFVLTWSSSLLVH